MPSTILSDNGVSSGSAGLKTTASNDGALVLQTTTSGGTATNAVYINTSQNVGLGVTPSAWTSSRKVLQFANGGSVSSSDTTSLLAASNAYSDGSNWRYIGNGFASGYEQVSSQHRWNIAASGSAGGTITFTQAMTLDASGNLLLGTSSGSVRFYSYNASGDNVNYFEKASGSKFVIYNSTSDSYVGTMSNTPFRMATNDTERARIDTSGNLLVGTTSAGAAGSNAYTAGSLCLGGATVSAGYKYCVINVNTGGSGSALSYQYAGAERAAVYWNQSNDRLFAFVGNSSTGVYMSNSATSWTANSDERLKTDLVPIENAAQKVSTLRAVTGRYKTDEEGVSRSFLIAQDVQAVLPEAVSVGSMPMSEDQTEYLGVSYTDVIPLLVAAIKELKAIVDAQAAEIAALKG